MNANQYPVTTPYGYVPGYPLHNGFHQGIDYGCPVGTPVVVNGVVIGLSGNTGYTFGPHLHLGKWLGGVVQNPYSGGFSFGSAVVTEVDVVGATDNGKFVRVQGDGASWVYLHLSSINVKVGQVLKGGTPMAEMTQSAAEKVVTYLYRLGTGDYPTPGQAEYWVPRCRDVPTGVDELGGEMLKAQAPAEFTPYSGEQLFVKKKN